MPVRAYKKRMPVVSVSGIALMPGMIIHFDIERAMVQKDQHIFIVMNKEAENNEELYRVGCVASVK